MEYKGYKIEQKDNKVIVEKVEDFNPVHVFDCGQCFRWIRQPDGSYTGVACGRALNVKYRMVCLGRDYSHIKEKVMKDEIMREAVKFGSGIRLLKQNIWETLISFIISANNRIPRIMKTKYPGFMAVK